MNEYYDPDNTPGTRAAREVREKLNNATPEERERLLQVALEMIYGPEWKDHVKTASTPS